MIRSRVLPALCFALANGLFMRLPSYRLRHWFLRRYCGVTIGEASSIAMGCFVTGYHVRIGDNTAINRGTYLDGRAALVIGNNVNIAHQTLIQTLTHEAQSQDFAIVARPVTIGDHVWIGARALICPGVCVGEGAVVGAGAVVAQDVPAYAIVAGNPARVIGERRRDLTYRTRYFPLFDTDIQ